MKNFLLLLLCCSVGLVLAGAPSPLRFQRVVIDDKPPQNPWIKIVGDLNGDGKPDIIIGGAQGPLVWYRNPDWQKFLIAADGYNTVAGAVADIDGDGDLDIALGGVVWFENPGPKGDPAKDPWPAHEVEKRRGHDLLAVDLDGDGKPDVVIGGSWFENSGDLLKGPWTEHVFTTEWD
jgi:FG-GAP-like repeat/FG-GAP repeat